VPELKEFLKGGDAESYEGVTIEYIPGRTAILTVFHDQEQVEKVQLSSLKSQQDMHDMMKEKGFTLKSPEEIAKLKVELEEAERTRKEEQQLKRDRRLKERREEKERLGQTSNADATDAKRMEQLKKRQEKLENDADATDAKRMEQLKKRQEKLEKRQEEKLASLPESERQGYLKHQEELEQRRHLSEQKRQERRSEHDQRRAQATMAAEEL
jgi:hypothetical protein